MYRSVRITPRIPATASLLEERFRQAHGPPWWRRPPASHGDPPPASTACRHPRATAALRDQKIDHLANVASRVASSRSGSIPCHVMGRGSARGQGTRCPFLRRTSMVPRSDVSRAVPVTSPSPCMAWPSPIDSNAPGTCTGRYRIEPATRSLLSRLPPCQPGGGSRSCRSASAGQRQSIPRTAPAATGCRARIPPHGAGRPTQQLEGLYGNSAGSTPPPGLNASTPKGGGSRSRSGRISSVSPGSAPST